MVSIAASLRRKHFIGKLLGGKICRTNSNACNHKVHQKEATMRKCQRPSPCAKPGEKGR